MTDPAQPAPVSRDTRQEECDHDWGINDDGTCVGCDEQVSASVVEASEDTEPVRCPVCGADRENCSGSRACDRFWEELDWPTPASDDEMTPGPRHPYMTAEKYRLSIFGLIKQDDEWPNTVADLMDGFEAAIRAPLEAAIKELQRSRAAHRIAVESAEEQLAAVTAERDRLLGHLTARDTLLAELQDFMLEMNARHGHINDINFDPGLASACGEFAHSIRVMFEETFKAAPATEEVQG